jgi:diguanylate cyclase (GGDEF)-like protein
MSSRPNRQPSLSGSTATNVLLIEDTQSDAALIKTYLEGYGESLFCVKTAPDIRMAIEVLANETVQAIVLDLFLPDTEDLSGLQLIRSMAPNVPVIILTGREDGPLAMRSVENGAQDYLIKEEMKPQTLRRALAYAIQRKRFESQMIHQANHDSLTGLSNRLQFMEKLKVAVAKHQRYNMAVAVLMIDLDGFKAVNDHYGHSLGDALLKEISQRLVLSMREEDEVARFGGDEFLVLLENIGEESQILSIAQKIQENIKRPFVYENIQIEVGSSIGGSYARAWDTLTTDQLLQRSDEAMYAAKKEGKNKFRLWRGR